jgi:hypothetical protein
MDQARRMDCFHLGNASEYLGRAPALPLDRVELLEGIPKFVSDELKQNRHDK